MTITPREKVREAFNRALLMSTAPEFQDSIDEAIEATAQALCLTPEAVQDALKEREREHA